GGQRPRPGRQEVVLPRAARGQRHDPARGDRPGEALGLEGAVPAVHHRVVDDGARHPGGRAARLQPVQEVGHRPAKKRSVEEPTQAKVESIEGLKERLGNAKTAVLTEYRGLTVRQLSDLRKQLKAAAAEYKVVKNRLARLAVKDSPLDSLAPHLKGPTGLV